MSESSEPSNPSGRIGPNGVNDRITGRESAHGLLVAMESADAEQYRQSYETTDLAFHAGYDALKRRDIPPAPVDYEVIPLDLSSDERRTLRRIARQHGMTVGEYLRTFFYPFIANLPKGPTAG